MDWLLFAVRRYNLRALSGGQIVIFFAFLLIGILAERLLPEIYPEMPQKKARLIASGIAALGPVIILVSALIKLL